MLEASEAPIGLVKKMIPTTDAELLTYNRTITPVIRAILYVLYTGLSTK